MAKSELVVTDQIVVSKIFYIRERKVVKRNMERFPEHFMLQLTDNEIDTMVS